MTAKEMISVKDALEIILRDIEILPSEKVPLGESVGRISISRRIISSASLTDIISWAVIVLSV